MPYLQHNGIRIYYRVEGEQGVPIVMLHGLTGSLDDFYEFGWVAGLKDDYRLILLDARGHGHSDKPHTPDAYSVELMAHDVIAVLDELVIDKAHFMGFSMGGFIGFGLAKYAPERLRSLVLIGADPYAPASPSDEKEHWRKVLANGMEAYLADAMAAAPWIVKTDWFINRRLANDRAALLAYSESSGQTDFGDILSRNTIPCLLYIGTKDEGYENAKRCAEEMANSQIFILTDKAHGQVFRESAAGIHRVRQFLAE